MTNFHAFNRFASMGLKSNKSKKTVQHNSSLVKKNAMPQFHSKFAMMERSSFHKIATLIAQISYKNAKTAIKLTRSMGE